MSKVNRSINKCDTVRKVSKDKGNMAPLVLASICFVALHESLYVSDHKLVLSKRGRKSLSCILKAQIPK